MLTILGSTGTIGRNTLSVIDMLGKTNSIFALTAEKNYKLLFTQIKKYKPLFAVILNEVDADILNNLCKKDKLKTKILFGKDAYNQQEYYTYFRVLETEDEYFDYYRKRHAFWKMYGLGLPDSILKKVYYKNALRILPSVNKSLFKS